QANIRRNQPKPEAAYMVEPGLVDMGSLFLPAAKGFFMPEAVGLLMEVDGEVPVGQDEGADGQVVLFLDQFLQQLGPFRAGVLPQADAPLQVIPILWRLQKVQLLLEVIIQRLAP